MSNTLKFDDLLATDQVDRVPCGHDEAAMRGRPKAQPVLSEAEHEQLTPVTTALWFAISPLE